jgi:glycerol-3-phosphate dehydrogenase
MRTQIESLSAWTGLTRERLKALFERYGTRAETIATYMNGGTDFIFKSLPDYSLREVIFIAQHEKVCHLDDFLLRRSMVAMLGRVNGEVIEELAKALANALGWDEERKTAEVARTLLLLTDKHGVRI